MVENNQIVIVYFYGRSRSTATARKPLGHGFTAVVVVSDHYHL
jgi:hypothetical protein